MPPLHEWNDFYVIVGSSAAALTGLMFVVIALGAERHKITEEALQSFATPTVVHFCATLLIAGFVAMPGQTATSLAACLLAAGSAGLVYSPWVAVRARRQTDYAPVLEDWIWHVALPVVAYLVLFVTAILLRRGAAGALYGVAGSALLLLFIGIHNAWDAAVWIATTSSQPSSQSSQSTPSSEPTPAPQSSLASPSLPPEPAPPAE
jgi:hypothetical protein